MNAPHKALTLATEIGKPDRADDILRQMQANSAHVREVREDYRAKRAANFAAIVRIAAFVKPTSSHRTMDQAELAIAYALGEGFTDEHIETLEAECGISSEFAHVLEEKRDAFLRDWGIGK